MKNEKKKERHPKCRFWMKTKCRFYIGIEQNKQKEEKQPQEKAQETSMEPETHLFTIRKLIKTQS